MTPANFLSVPLPNSIAKASSVLAASDLGEFDGIARRAMLGFVGQEIKLNGAGYRLPAAINESVASFVRVLDGRAEQLHLPQDMIAQPNDESWA